MSERTDKLLSLTKEATERGILKKLVLSMPDSGDAVKTVVSPKIISGQVMLQAERFLHDNKAVHLNFEISELKEKLACMAEDFMRITLITTAGEASYMRSRAGKETVVGENRAMALNAPIYAAEGNNKKKKHILSGNEKFLKELNVSDANGRIYDKKQAKFRQINRFLEIIAETVDNLPDKSVGICDLCCGKSYLTFAVYHYFTEVLKRDVRMVGMDLKPDVISYCSDVAKNLGYTGLSFICGDIREYRPDFTVDLVVSLHACDTATDIVLDKAVDCGARVILSTPCCHHELNHTLNCPAVDFIAKYSMLRQKFCDAATDAARLLKLEAAGYDTAAIELIDPEETPKNILLRGIKKNNGDPEAEKKYQEVMRFLTGKQT